MNSRLPAVWLLGACCVACACGSLGGATLAAAAPPPANSGASTAADHPAYVDKKSEANGRSNLNPPPPGGTRLDGLYATQDSGGQLGPGGVMSAVINWRFYYFLPSGYVYLGAKSAGLEALACDRPTVNEYGDPMCTTYTVENDKLRIGLRNPVRLRHKGSDLLIGDYTFERIAKANNLRLNGSYDSFSAGTAAASSASITFQPTGKFQSSHFVGVAVDTDPTASLQPGSARVTVSGSSTGRAEGSYRINGYTLELNYSDGRRARAFFAQVAGDQVLRIGGRVYTRHGK